MQQVITDYPQFLYKTKTNLNNNKLEVSGDDPIVNIVPREYFLTIGEHIYIGKEYGFFVNTQVQEETSQNKIVEVLVFDINTNNNLEQTFDRLIVRVEPVFQYYYGYLVGVESNVFYSETSLDISYSINSNYNYVVPLPNGDNRFEAYNKYYLKDIS